MKNGKNLRLEEIFHRKINHTARITLLTNFLQKFSLKPNSSKYKLSFYKYFIDYAY